MWTLSRFVVIFSLINFSAASVSQNETIVERPLFIGAFNIQKLGNSKSGNTKVMDIVKRVLLRYDLVLIQEIVTTDETLMNNLLRDLNKLAAPNEKFLMKISERLGRDRAKEQYAFLYRSQKFRYLRDEAYPDPEDRFMRPPYIVHFASPTLRDAKSFLAIGIHTQPKNAANETSALADVYDYAAKRYRERNAILMGDMNAGCQNVRISDWESIDLWTREEFQWLIKHDTDTTVSANCCPYDRIVIAGSGMQQAVIWNSINVFNFKDLYDLSTEEVLEISDHWPVEVQLRGNVSPEVAKYLKAQLCLTIDDSRKTDLPPEIQKQKSTMGFRIERYDRSTSLVHSGDDLDDILMSLEKLAAKYPELVSKELSQAVSYKASHGALDDRSSNADSEQSYTVVVDFDNSARTLSVHFCAWTTIN